MQVTTISQFRKSAKKYFDDVISNQDILIIARSDGSSIVAMPLEQYNTMTETEYLLSNPTNAARILKSAEQARQGKVKERKLIKA